MCFAKFSNGFSSSSCIERVAMASSSTRSQHRASDRSTQCRRRFERRDNSSVAKTIAQALNTYIAGLRVCVCVLIIHEGLVSKLSTQEELWYESLVTALVCENGIRWINTDLKLSRETEMVRFSGLITLCETILMQRPGCTWTCRLIVLMCAH